MVTDKDVLGLMTDRGVGKMIMQMNRMIIFMRVMGSKLAIIFSGRIVVWIVTKINMVIIMHFFLWCIINLGSSIMGWQPMVGCIC